MRKGKIIFERAVMLFCSLLLASLCISMVSCSKMAFKPLDYESGSVRSDMEYGNPSGQHMW